MERPKRIVNKPARCVTTSSDESPKRRESTVERTIVSDVIDRDFNDINRMLDENHTLQFNTRRHTTRHRGRVQTCSHIQIFPRTLDTLPSKHQYTLIHTQRQTYYQNDTHKIHIVSHLTQNPERYFILVRL